MLSYDLTFGPVPEEWVMAENGDLARSPIRMILTVLVIVVLPLASGLFAAPRLVPEPQIGVIRLSQDITSLSAFEITEQLAYARDASKVKAIVLVINSPGGSAAYSEELYLDVLNTRDELPVVATVDLLAASGAYYMAAAADAIYAKPTSAVGSIGVIASLPGDVFIEEEQLTTGPYKSFGGTRDGFVRQMERAKFAFLEAVASGRGEKLNADLSFLSRAEIFTGVQALELGLIDALVSGDEAVSKAAELAGLSRYEVVELYPLVFGDESSASLARYQPAPVDAQTLWAYPSNLPPGLYYRYVAPPVR
jgi:protease-4